MSTKWNDVVDHVRYREWLRSAVRGPQAYGVAPQVLASMVRITTHPGIFVRPSKLEDAFAFCRALLERPNATVVVPGDRHFQIFEDLCRTSRASGNLVQDAWFAAMAIESACDWITTDRDYARFKGLSWSTPWP